MTAHFTRQAKRRAGASPIAVATHLPSLDKASDAVLPAAVASNYWRARVPWYPSGCFGPYRAPTVGYSRRELAADGIVHCIGLLGGAILTWYLLTNLDTELPPQLAGGIRIYGASLMTMLVCSSAFNGLAWSKAHLRWLQLADHFGILLLISGSYTPVMLKAGCPKLLAVNWSVAALSAVIKATGSRLDVVAVHIPIFIILGWSLLAVWDDVWSHLSTWAKGQCLMAGGFYSGGLIPWAANRIEGHNAMWHVCVFAGSACIYSVVALELSRPGAWVRA